MILDNEKINFESQKLLDKTKSVLTSSVSKKSLLMKRLLDLNYIIETKNGLIYASDVLDEDLGVSLGKKEYLLKENDKKTTSLTDADFLKLSNFDIFELDNEKDQYKHLKYKKADGIVENLSKDTPFYKTGLNYFIDYSLSTKKGEFIKIPLGSNSLYVSKNIVIADDIEAYSDFDGTDFIPFELDEEDNTKQRFKSVKATFDGYFGVLVNKDGVIDYSGYLNEDNVKDVFVLSTNKNNGDYDTILEKSETLDLYISTLKNEGSAVNLNGLELAQEFKNNRLTGRYMLKNTYGFDGLEDSDGVLVKDNAVIFKDFKTLKNSKVIEAFSAKNEKQSWKADFINFYKSEYEKAIENSFNKVLKTFHDKETRNRIEERYKQINFSNVYSSLKYNTVTNNLDRKIGDENKVQIDDIMTTFLQELSTEQDYGFKKFLDMKTSNKTSVNIFEKDCRSNNLKIGSDYNKEFDAKRKKYQTEILLDFLDSNNNVYSLSQNLLEVKKYYDRGLKKYEKESPEIKLDNKKKLQQEVLDYIEANCPNVYDVNARIFNKYIATTITPMKNKVSSILEGTSIPYPSEKALFTYDDGLFRYEVVKKNKINIYDADDIVNNYDGGLYSLRKTYNGKTVEVANCLYAPDLVESLSKELTKDGFQKMFYDSDGERQFALISSADISKDYYGDNRLNVINSANDEFTRMNTKADTFIRNLTKGDLGIVYNANIKDQISFIKIESSNLNDPNRKSGIYIQTVKAPTDKTMEDFLVDTKKRQASIEDFTIETKPITLNELNEFIHNSTRSGILLKTQQYNYDLHNIADSSNMQELAKKINIFEWKDLVADIKNRDTTTKLRELEKLSRIVKYTNNINLDDKKASLEKHLFRTLSLEKNNPGSADEDRSKIIEVLQYEGQRKIIIFENTSKSNGTEFGTDVVNMKVLTIIEGKNGEPDLTVTSEYKDVLDVDYNTGLAKFKDDVLQNNSSVRAISTALTNQEHNREQVIEAINGSLARNSTTESVINSLTSKFEVMMDLSKYDVELETIYNLNEMNIPHSDEILQALQYIQDNAYKMEELGLKPSNSEEVLNSFDVILDNLPEPTNKNEAEALLNLKTSFDCLKDFNQIDVYNFKTMVDIFITPDINGNDRYPEFSDKSFEELALTYKTHKNMLVNGTNTNRLLTDESTFNYGSIDDTVAVISDIEETKENIETVSNTASNTEKIDSITEELAASLDIIPSTYENYLYRSSDFKFEPMSEVEREKAIRERNIRAEDFAEFMIENNMELVFHREITEEGHLKDYIYDDKIHDFIIKTFKEKIEEEKHKKTPDEYYLNSLIKRLEIYEEKHVDIEKSRTDYLENIIIPALNRLEVNMEEKNKELEKEDGVYFIPTEYKEEFSINEDLEGVLGSELLKIRDILMNETGDRNNIVLSEEGLQNTMVLTTAKQNLFEQNFNSLTTLEKKILEKGILYAKTEQAPMDVAQDPYFLNNRMLCTMRTFREFIEKNPLCEVPKEERTKNFDACKDLSSIENINDLKKGADAFYEEKKKALENGPHL